MMCLFSVYSGADGNFCTIFTYDDVVTLCIKRNLNLETDDGVAWCRAAVVVASTDSIIFMRQELLCMVQIFFHTYNST